MPHPSFTVEELAARVNGTVKGDASRTIHSIADLKTAQPHQLCFLGNPRYLAQAQTSHAGAILCIPDHAGQLPTTAIIVENPSLAFSLLSPLFLPRAIEWAPGIHPTAVVAPDAKIASGAHIGPHAVVEPGAELADGVHLGAGSYVGHECKIGEGTFIYPNVTIRERCLIGKRVILHSGCVIGADGFGYEFKNGLHEKIPQVGIVQIDDDVEIGACATVDRGRFDRTWIQEGAKIDNLVLIAHNCIVGKHNIIVGQSGLSGSVHTGDYVTIAAQSGVAGHLELGTGSTLTAQSGLAKNIPPKQIFSGRHARPMREAMKIEACAFRLPGLYERVKALEARLRELETEREIKHTQNNEK